MKKKSKIAATNQSVLRVIGRIPCLLLQDNNTVL